MLQGLHAQATDRPAADLHEHGGLRHGGHDDAADGEARDDAAVAGARPRREDEDRKLAVHAAGGEVTTSSGAAGQRHHAQHVLLCTA